MLNDLCIRHSLVLGVLIALAAVSLGIIYGLAAALVVVAVGALCMGVYLHLILSILSEIEDLNQAIDGMLAEGRRPCLSRAERGAISSLASKIDKTFNEINLARMSEYREKTSLSDSLANISHQIRTPLTAMELELELLRDCSNKEQHSQHIYTLRRQLEHIDQLISSLLKLARLDAGVIRCKKETLTLRDLVDDAFKPLAISYDLSGISFENHIDKELVVTGDSAWTAEALTNILKNCREHTPSGGHVWVKASSNALATRIQIFDSGKGIDPELLPHIFERFYSGKNSDLNPDGVGIGLSLAQTIIQQQGGVIKASNNYDEQGQRIGALFDIAFYKHTI